MPAQFTDPLPDTQLQQAHQQHPQRHSQSGITTSTSATAAFHAGAGTHQRKKSVVAATLPSSASFPNGGFAAQQLEGNGSHRILTGTSRIQSGKDVSGQVIFDEREVMVSFPRLNLHVRVRWESVSGVEKGQSELSSCDNCQWVLLRVRLGNFCVCAQKRISSR